VKIARISEYQVRKLMSKGQDEFVKDKIIYHIVTKPPSIEQVVGKY
jgi:hypothetical protein